MKVGERVSAEVTDVKDNGIFLSHEGLPGIITVVELTWDETKRPVPADFASRGDALELLVMTAHDAGFSGSLKRLRPEDDPRSHAALTDSSVLAATVRAMPSFGVLVNLPIGLVAKLDPCPDTLREKLEVGSEISVIVAHVDEGTGKITVRPAGDES